MVQSREPYERRLSLMTVTYYDAKGKEVTKKEFVAILRKTRLMATHAGKSSACGTMISWIYYFLNEF